MSHPYRNFFLTILVPKTFTYHLQRPNKYIKIKIESRQIHLKRTRPKQRK